MRIAIEVDLTAAEEQRLRELVGEWASPERMAESDAPFKIQLEQCCKAGLRHLHDRQKKDKAVAA